MTFDAPIHLKDLTTREAINDAFNRVLLAFDTKSHNFLSSSVTEDIVFAIEGVGEMSGFDQVYKAGLESTAGVDIQHFATQVRIDVKSEEATEALLTANVLAYHYPKGEGMKGRQRRFVRGSVSALRMVKGSEGLWRAKRWDMRVTWFEGDPSIMQPSA